MTDVTIGREERLPAILGSRFSSNSRHRGEDYFREHRVTIDQGSPAEVRASVQGSSRYNVSLQWSGGRLASRCNCPFFKDQGNPCKHLWATILAAEQQGHLSDITAAFPVLAPTGILVTEADPSRALPKVALVKRPPAWKAQLSRIAENVAPERSGKPQRLIHAEIAYILDVAKSQSSNSLVLGITTRQRGKDGRWRDLPKPLTIRREAIASLPLAEDREILGLLMGGDPFPSYGYYGSYDRGADWLSLSGPMVQTMLSLVLKTKRCYLPFSANDLEKAPLDWDDGEPWRFALEIQGSSQAGWHLSGHFRRGEQRMAAKEPLVATTDGILIMPSCVARVANEETTGWILGLRTNSSVAVLEEDRDEFLGGLLHLPGLPPLELPQEWKYDEVTAVPRPTLRIYRPDARFATAKERMKAQLSFAYQEYSVEATTESRGIYNAATRQFFVRDRAVEQAATEKLQDLGLRFTTGMLSLSGDWNIAPGKLPAVVRALVDAGWQVTAEGKVFRQPGKTTASVNSGVDWFELQGSVTYGDSTATLPQLLAAVKRGETMVTLDDGTYGLLPEEWLRRVGRVATMGEAEEDHIRFSSSQAGLLDALLATQPLVDCDEAFRRVRSELSQFVSVKVAEQPAGFEGHLRDYQREGLGWMHFLRQFGFGGCLADDMGVGKTAQVLAMLEERRVLRAQGTMDAPSLVVVPKSLVFNWKQESQRFTPLLRVLDYTGIGRGSKDVFSGYDLILTTYGTLRRDAVQFQDTMFDYIILDEAQAIKNEKTESAKAVRLLRGSYRLAMSGTPIENHLGELWSLFAFLNPGMLGGSAAFARAAASGADPDGETRKLLAHALRPFLLRRTKEQVARELPAKVEQTIYCELEKPQRKLYNELRDHYRERLLGKIGKDGLAKAKIQVLEALLRLRQAACHPGLVDRKRVQDPSAKLEILVGQLRAVLEEGHKALVFSQFTSLLAILRERLDAEEIVYEYLDGKTIDRQARVEHFQQDAGCPVFLISLKAGGVGLNLTAADYVFILDPWWNPAVEAQAVDRTHRIGQVRQVFAYRLIARDTVEEKVLQLQETKRNLADAIIGENNSLVRDMTREDIALLLS